MHRAVHSLRDPSPYPELLVRVADLIVPLWLGAPVRIGPTACLAAREPVTVWMGGVDAPAAMLWCQVPMGGVDAPFAAHLWLDLQRPPQVDGAPLWADAMSVLLSAPRPPLADVGTWHQTIAARRRSVL